MIDAWHMHNQKQTWNHGSMEGFSFHGSMFRLPVISFSSSKLPILSTLKKLTDSIKRTNNFHLNHIESSCHHPGKPTEIKIKHRQRGIPSIIHTSVWMRSSKHLSFFLIKGFFFVVAMRPTLFEMRISHQILSRDSHALKVHHHHHHQILMDL